MNTKFSLLLKSFICVLFTLFLVSCSSDDDDDILNMADSNVGIFVLNSGSMSRNNASLTFYDLERNKSLDNVFKRTNNKSLGDTGQDLLIYQDKMYIAVYGSNVIYVTDKYGKELGQIQPVRDGQPQSPRSLTAYNGKIYVTLFDGYLAKIDPTTLEIEAQVKVGRNPESVKAANNKLYVANSGGLDYNTSIGYDKTVSVIDVSTFTELKKMDVVLNPVKLSDPNSNGYIFLISNGNYKDIPNTLQRINTQTDEVETLTGINATWMSMNNDKLYVIYSQYDANFNTTISYWVYDTNSTLQATPTNFITDGTIVNNPYCITTDSINNYVCIGTSDYKTNGDMYIFTSDGKLVRKFDTGGINPMGAYYINLKK